jgi:hypothetical protein
VSALDEYLLQVRAVVDLSRHALTDDELASVDRLIDHDEPAEGLHTLAWIVVEKNKRVPVEVIEGIRRLTAGLVDPNDLPPNLDLQVIK